MIEERELVIVGGGPSGMAATLEARRAGAQVTLIEDRASLGGQIFRQPLPGLAVQPPRAMGKDYAQGLALINETLGSGAEVLTNHVVWGVWGQDTKEVSLYRAGQHGRTLKTTKLILAAGAYDRPVPFPGWTLPGVITAGGAQSMVKAQGVLPGKRLLVAGSGPLLLAFSAQLHSMGALVVSVLEAAPRPTLSNALNLLAAAAHGNWGLLRQGIAYATYLRRHGIPLLYGHGIARAEGVAEVERAVAVRVDKDWRPIRDSERTFDVDTLVVGYGFFPSTEIARAIGCRLSYEEQLGGYAPVRSDEMESTVPGVFVVGDCARIAGSAVAVEEGRLAGVAAARQLGKLSGSSAAARSVAPRRRLSNLQRLGNALGKIYRVGPGIYEWATDDTVVCRCEEITAGDLRRNILPGSRDPNSAKSLTRAGMGLCQGRLCARQVSHILARETGQLSNILSLTSRPPVRPVPIGLIADGSPEKPRTELPEALADDLVGPSRDREVTSTSSEDQTDVLIIGAGLVGCAAAYYLTREKIDCLVVDRAEINREGSGRNAGSLHIQLRKNERLLPGRTLVEFARTKAEAGRVWAGVERELGTALGVSLRGGFIAAETAEEFELLRETVDLDRKLGLEVELLPAADVLALAPCLSNRLMGAAYYPWEGCANPLLVAPAYARLAMRGGARFRTYTRVSGIRPLAGSGFLVSTNTGQIRARRILDAAGSAAGRVSAMAGVHLRVGGCVIQASVTECRKPILQQLFAHWSEGLTLKQAANGSFIIGGGWPAVADSTTKTARIHRRNVEGNVGMAMRFVPVLRDFSLLRTWLGVTAYSVDRDGLNLPVFGELPAVPGFFVAAGRSMFTFGPLFARLSAELISSGRTSLPVGAYDPGRFVEGV